MDFMYEKKYVRKHKKNKVEEHAAALGREEIRWWPQRWSDKSEQKRSGLVVYRTSCLFKQETVTAHAWFSGITNWVKTVIQLRSKNDPKSDLSRFKFERPWEIQVNILYRRLMIWFWRYKCENCWHNDICKSIGLNKITRERMSGIIPINSNILRSTKGRKTGKRLWQIAVIVEGENPIYDSVMKAKNK